MRVWEQCGSKTEENSSFTATFKLGAVQYAQQKLGIEL